jgi:hypothetical protein
MSRMPGVLITTRRSAALVAVTFGLLMLVASLGFDWLLLRHRGMTDLTVAISDVFVGLLAGVLAWTLLGYELKERDKMEKRIEVLNEVNHHIRNALQTVAMALPRLEQHSEVEDLRAAIERIRWTLQEVLPTLEPRYETLKGSAREMLRRQGEDAERG